LPIPTQTVVDAELGLSFLIFEPYSNLSPSQKEAIPSLEKTPEPVFHERGVRLYHGDALELLRRAKTETFDLIFADPPYFLSSGGITCQNGQMVSVNKGDWDKSVSPEKIHEFNSAWLRECHRLLKPDGTLQSTVRKHESTTSRYPNNESQWWLCHAGLP